MEHKNSSVYCTYFDSNYFSRGLAMIQSLRKNNDESKIYVLALDDSVYSEITSLAESNIVALTLTQFESYFPELLSVKADRSPMEYVFTLTPYLTMYTQQSEPDALWTTYLDADLYFFSSTQPIYEELKDSSVGMISHRFTRDQKWREKYGIYNVSWVSFRSNKEGRKCLNWWAESCLNWCGDEPSQGRFADQGYLNEFPRVSRDVHVIQHPGANLAPWNIRNHHLRFHDGGSIQVDERDLIFFHFHGVKIEGSRFFFKHIPYLVRTSKGIKESIYRGYCEQLYEIEVTRTSQRHLLFNDGALLRKPSVFRNLNSMKSKTIRVLTVLRGDFLDI